MIWAQLMSYATTEVKPTLNSRFWIETPTPPPTQCALLWIFNWFRKFDEWFRNLLCFMMVTAQAHQTFKKDTCKLVVFIVCILVHVKEILARQMTLPIRFTKHLMIFYFILVWFVSKNTFHDPKKLSYIKIQTCQ